MYSGGVSVSVANWGDIERISRDDGVELVQHLRGYSIDAGCSLLTSSRQLQHCCPHTFGVCLAIILTQLCPTSALDSLTSADRGCASFLHLTCTHQHVYLQTKTANEKDGHAFFRFVKFTHIRLNENFYKPIEQRFSFKHTHP